MREINIKNGNIILKDKVEVVIEKVVTKFGTSAKADVPRKYIGKRAYIVILEN